MDRGERDAAGRITKITWLGSETPAHEFSFFGWNGPNPGEEGVYTFIANQTYASGEVVTWEPKVSIVKVLSADKVMQAVNATASEALEEAERVHEKVHTVEDLAEDLMRTLKRR